MVNPMSKREFSNTGCQCYLTNPATDAEPEVCMDLLYQGKPDSMGRA